jgi:hypothetical protein
VTAPAGWPEAMRAVQDRHPAVKLLLHRFGAARVSLSLIQVRPGQPRGAGLAEAALGDLCATADRWAVTVALTPEPLGGGVSRARLARWYARHGFRVVPRRERDGEHDDTMARAPR